MKKYLIMSLLAIGLLVVPAEAAAHRLSNGRAKPLAQRICTRINQVPADENPYICTRVNSGIRRHPHRIDYPLSLFDPNDGERCTANVVIRFRNSRSFSIVALRGRHDCLADPFAGV